MADWIASNSRPGGPTADLAILVQRLSDHTASSLWELRQLRETADMPVVVVSDDGRPDTILRALDLGARAYIPSSIGIDIALEAIRIVTAGGTFVPANSLSDYRRTSDREKGIVWPLSLFTDRQQAVIALLRQGKSNKTIAHELNMRESTVKVHVRNIMKAIHAKNRTEIAVRLSSVNGDAG
ncbi:response regulator transcription factor [Kaistia geumhonensis]|uniref:DNA-binding NarL/FixJ family response regulator n=1 Tax=Kaistia geumhonensis TaxID=410839 RepID=A0ABU0M9D4_9HYPH|nr:response regulator transcription factor [Kaistia geumhonensis]MCX5480714.1 response regulator transcription factor [Kaistia geumhonensis]MDQ0517582.1 DNA-binding NarL/FixJ family response regulator [Kaistia geumhonensis]